MKLADFSISSFTRERQEMLDPNQLEGTLSYMSPEQTGRMNRIIDYRIGLLFPGGYFLRNAHGSASFSNGRSVELFIVILQ